MRAKRAGRAGRRLRRASGGSGKTSHSQRPRSRRLASSPRMRASTWRRTRRRKASVGFGAAGVDAGEFRAVARPAGRTSRGPAARGRPAARRPAGSPVRAGRRPVPRCGARRPRARERPPSAPSSQRRSSAVSHAGQLGGERAVGGVEHVVALVEHVARRHGVVVEAAPGRLRHDQRVVGDHQLGGAGAADRVLDEAAPPMRAGGVDALAAAVGQAGDQRRRRTVRRTSRAGRRPGCRRRRSPAPSGRSGRAGSALLAA